MHLVVRPPRNPIVGQHVAMLWHCESPTASGNELVSPTGRVQIVVPMAEGSSDPVFAGVFTGPQPIDASDQRRACGVVFRVGHTGAFVSAPLSEFTNAQPELDRSFWKGEQRLAGRLADSTGPETLFDALERTLLDALNDEWAPDATVAAAIDMLDRGVPVNEVVSRLGVDRRKFGRHFTDVVGVAPKQFSRTRRFQRAVRRIRRAGTTSLAELAVDLGYSDQAHMSREFREFSGSTASVAHGIESPSPGHFAAT